MLFVRYKTNFFFTKPYQPMHLLFLKFSNQRLTNNKYNGPCQTTGILENNAERQSMK